MLASTASAILAADEAQGPTGGVTLSAEEIAAVGWVAQNLAADVSRVSVATVRDGADVGWVVCTYVPPKPRGSRYQISKPRKAIISPLGNIYNEKGEPAS